MEVEVDDSDSSGVSRNSDNRFVTGGSHASVSSQTPNIGSLLNVCKHPPLAATRTTHRHRRASRWICQLYINCNRVRPGLNALVRPGRMLRSNCTRVWPGWQYGHWPPSWGLCPCSAAHPLACPGVCWVNCALDILHSPGCCIHTTSCSQRLDRFCPSRASSHIPTPSTHCWKEFTERFKAL